MTLRPFGRVTPIQIDMLSLAGYGTDYRSREIRVGDTDERRKRNMRRGRRALRRATRKDLGYDLADWHNFLAADPEHGYTHAYAFGGVARAIVKAVADRVRQRLADELAAEED
jgi:hypothetical protein